MGITDRIEAFINELMRDEADFTEFGRNEIAEVFGCVPSQINYVISTRFSPERGYVVESRRGGGGYIRIRKINLGEASDVIAGIADGVSFENAKLIIKNLFEIGKIEKQTANILLGAVSERALNYSNNREKVRADILKNALLNL